MAFDSFKTKRRSGAPTSSSKVPLPPPPQPDQQIVLQVVDAYQSVLYAQREIDVAQHEEQTAEALLGQAMIT